MQVLAQNFLTIKLSLIFHQGKLASNTLNNKFCISASIVNVNVFAHNVSFMVLLSLILGKHKDHDVKTVRKAQPIVKT